MPHNFDFSKLKNIKTIEISPKGWISPLYVEYGIYTGAETGEISSYFWRVKGTSHTFVIPISRMDYLSSGDYKKHIENVLEVFKEDYLLWNTEGFIHEWSREYRDQYSRYIVI
jgi:hypothetical protein